MSTLFEAYVTNMGKYNEGALVGEYLKFPTTMEEVQALLKRIGIDGVRFDSGEHTSSVADLINLAQNLDCYEFYVGVTDDETLGRIYAEDMEMIDIPEHLRNYFDYEAYGRDIRINDDGHFAPGGYVLNNGSKFIEHYHGVEDIPDEHKVFAFPRLSVREQMAAYKEIIDSSSLEGYRKISGKAHDDR